MNSYISQVREELLRAFPCYKSGMQILELMAAEHAKGLLIRDASLFNESRWNYVLYSGTSMAWIFINSLSYFERDQ